MIRLKDDLSRETIDFIISMFDKILESKQSYLFKIPKKIWDYDDYLTEKDFKDLYDRIINDTLLDIDLYYIEQIGMNYKLSLYEAASAVIHDGEDEKISLNHSKESEEIEKKQQEKFVTDAKYVDERLTEFSDVYGAYIKGIRKQLKEEYEKNNSPEDEDYYSEEY